MPVQVSDINSWASTDPVLVMHGWPITVSDDNLFTYMHRKDDLSIEDECIYSVGIKDCWS